LTRPSARALDDCLHWTNALCDSTLTSFAQYNWPFIALYCAAGAAQGRWLALYTQNSFALLTKAEDHSRQASL